MRQVQINRLEMFSATNDYLDSHNAIWSAIPILGNYKNELSIRIIAIKEAALAQDAAQVFIGKSIRDNKAQIAEKMDALDDILEAYADDTGNAELRTQAANNYSDYLRLPHEEFEVKVQNIISLLETHTPDTADYGMTPAQVEDVKLQFNEFQSQRGKPRSYKIASKVATQNIEDLFEEADDFVKKLDMVMKRFKRSNTTFYNGYLASRVIVGK